jgi:hypothetical protein
VLAASFEIGARQVIKQNVETSVEQRLPSGDQMLAQGVLVPHDPVQTAVEPILLGHLKLALEQLVHGTVHEPAAVNRKLAPRRTQTIDSK